MGKKKRMKIDGRTYRGTLDKFLADKQLKRKPIAKDGSCLFRAVAEQVSINYFLHEHYKFVIHIVFTAVAERFILASAIIRM